MRFLNQALQGRTCSSASMQGLYAYNIPCCSSKPVGHNNKSLDQPKIPRKISSEMIVARR